MNLDTHLARDLERAIPQLPAAPATAYLTAGRRARLRRRAFVGVAGAAAIALTGGAVTLAGGGTATDPAGPATSATAAPDPGAIPDWAQEYGNHGPVSIDPDGELWVAPDARLIRSVEIPASSFRQDDVVSAFVAEAEFEGEVWWSFVVRTSTSPKNGTQGFMEPADDWTTDFDVWADYATAADQGRPRFKDRLVRFADGTSEQLVARTGAEIVDQVDGVVLPSTLEGHPRSSVAEVTYSGRTWFVLAQGPRAGAPFYSPYQAEVVSASDIHGFLDFLQDRAGEGK